LDSCLVCVLIINLPEEAGAGAGGGGHTAGKQCAGRRAGCMDGTGLPDDAANNTLQRKKENAAAKRQRKQTVHKRRQGRHSTRTVVGVKEELPRLGVGDELHVLIGAAEAGQVVVVVHMEVLPDVVKHKRRVVLARVLNAHKHAPTHAHPHAHTHARTHTRTLGQHSVTCTSGRAHKRGGAEPSSTPPPISTRHPSPHGAAP
jgi:hypothetical protein